MTIYLGKWGFNAEGDIIYTIDHDVGVIKKNGEHTRTYDSTGQLDGEPTHSHPNIFNIVNDINFDYLLDYFQRDKQASKMCFAEYDDTKTFIDNVVAWLRSTQNYKKIETQKPSHQYAQKYVRDYTREEQLAFGYYHMTHINPYTKIYRH